MGTERTPFSVMPDMVVADEEYSPDVQFRRDLK